MSKKAFVFVFVGFLILFGFVETFGISNVSFWNTYHGNNNRSCYIKSGKYAKPTLTPEWDFSVGNRFISHPVIWNDKIYTGNNKNFYAVDISTGSIIWTYKSEFTTNHTPSVYNGNVFLTEKNAGKWNIISLDGKTGKRNKRIQMPSEPTFTLCSDGTAYYSIKEESGDERYAVYHSINLDDGTTNWSKELPGEYTFDCLDDGKLYIRKAFFKKNDDYPPGNIYALDAKTGDVLWEHEPTENEGFDNHIIASDGLVFIASKLSKTESKITALDSNTGVTTWQYKAETSNSKCRALSNDKLLITNEDDGLTCLGAKTGDIIWKASDLEMSDSLVASTDEIIFACFTDSNLSKKTNKRMKSRLVSIDIIDGEILSDKDFPYTPQSLVLDNNRVYVSAAEGKLYSYTRKMSLVGIIVKPTELFVVPGSKFQFETENYDIREVEIENLDIRWVAEPAGIGKIDKTGLFTAGNGDTSKGFVKAIHGDIFGISMIFICPPPKLTTDKIDFGLQKQGDELDSKTVMFNMDMYCRANIKLGKVPEWINASIPDNDPKTEFLQSTISVNTTKLSSGIHEGIVEYIWDGGVLELTVFIEIVSDDTEIISLTTDKLDFGNIKSASTGKIQGTFGIIATLKNPVGCDVKSDADWLSFYPVYSKVDKYQEITATCDTSKIKPGESLEATVTVTPDAGKPVELKVTANKLAGTTIVLQIDSTTATVNGNPTTLDVPPQIVSGRTMVPIRIISESLGAGVDWNGTEKKITITLTTPSGKKTSVEMWVNKNTARVDGADVKLDAPPTVIDGRTLVPVRFITEAFGANVSWNQSDKTVTIVYTP